MVKTCKVIYFKCKKCGTLQFAEDTLEDRFYPNCHVGSQYTREDKIDCTECGHENHVVEEL